MKYIYAPGCALMTYKPHLAEKLKSVIEKKYGQVDTQLTCCFNQPEIENETCIISPCTTCTVKYSKNYPNCKTEFFLKTLAESNDFDFPDYEGIEMSIQDTCSSRTEPDFLATIRRLLERMNIRFVEPVRSGAKAKCCGQTLYGKTEISKIESFMKTRANEMPCYDVVVYCASCIMSMTVGGRQPRYILDLIFNEPTIMADAEIDIWNKKLRQFRKSH